MTVELRGLKDKVAFVTGAGRGQGANHARQLAKAGCDVAVLDICEPMPPLYATATAEDLELTAKQVRAEGRRSLALQCDVRDEDAVAAAAERALEEFGHIDILINNAGMAALDTIHEIRSDVLHAVIDTNVKGPMFCAKYLVGDMIGRRSGTIINISSAVIGSGHAMLSHYVASKHAVVGLTKSWATELSEFDINVNAIAPATIRPGEGQGGSGMVLGLSEAMEMDPDEAFEVFSEQGNLPGDKWRAEMQDITDAVLFLASDNARMITGHVLHVDCGQATR
ncbi:SDR family NAD(P)-dependent oxidoreductase [Euzebya tangerina]|uniref:SDR family NAD(P)-dependent oxidoreductase n=1 Tax=Euzebya tangerina TaxID=591198 RepID=UPI000E320D39|nr:SDR family NAD(P)-dependent oxidoreductase [Euzebya tangerina]